MSKGSPHGARWLSSMVIATCALVLIVRMAHADDIRVPVELQATLLMKMAAYDRNLAKRAGDRVRVLLVGNPRDPSSMPFIRQMSEALAGIDSIDRLPHDEEIFEYKSPDDLVLKCRAGRVAIVYFGPGFRSETDAIARALESFSILTAAAAPDDVRRGIMLGFDLVASKPKLVVNLNQARKQNIDFRSDVLKLVRIVE